MYALRITMPRDDTKLLQFMEGFEYICYAEVAANEHYHLALKINNLKKFRNKLTYSFPRKYSLTLVKTENYLAYVVKDGVLVYNNLLCDECHNHALAKDSEIKSDLSKTKGKSNLTYTQKIIRDYVIIDDNFRNQKDFIKTHIISYINNKSIPQFNGVDKIICRRLYFGIMYEYYPDVFAMTTKSWYENMD